MNEKIVFLYIEFCSKINVCMVYLQFVQFIFLLSYFTAFFLEISLSVQANILIFILLLVNVQACYIIIMIMNINHKIEFLPLNYRLRFYRTKLRKKVQKSIVGWNKGVEVSYCLLIVKVILILQVSLLFIIMILLSSLLQSGGVGFNVKCNEPRC